LGCATIEDVGKPLGERRHLVGFVGGEVDALRSGRDRVQSPQAMWRRTGQPAMEKAKCSRRLVDGDGNGLDFFRR
jgi:hypothetical protein